ncbi:MAG TPA: methyltransferase domain-containing protein [Candidatus Kapabacteria bacterium]|nr:methyltransferase domain-containing protein [Candidatus Kapabacteria bacterium]
MTDRGQTSEFFDAEAAQWNERYTADPRFARRFERITSLLDQTHPTLGRMTDHPRALDAGCGTGVFSRYLASRGWQVTAIDASPEMIEAAIAASPDASIEFANESYESYRSHPNSFDLILSLSVIEYLEDDEAAIQKFAEWLKPGGLLIVSVPNRKGLLRIIEAAIFGIRTITRGRFFGERGEYLKYQKRQYSPLELGLIMRQYGLRRRKGIFLNAGFSGPKWLLPFFERRWWAAMYCAAYVKR